MLQMHNLLKIQCHQDENVNLQTRRTEEAVEKESKDRSVIRKLSLVLSSSLSFRKQDRWQLTGQMHLMCQQY